MKFLEKNKHVDKANWPWSCNNFLEMTPKQLTKTKTKWDYIKLKKKSFYSKNNDQQNEKATSGMGENICQTHIR